MTELKTLADTAALDAAIAESRQRPVLLFKHSRTCGISCEAFEQLQAHIAASGLDAAYRLITVQTHRRVADEVATRLRVRHESPQAILLRDGDVVWHGSHFRITTDELKRVMS
ncbi:MAG TPA: bacillithiol system redox-active protein YtxJ [Vicinamibacterales bacterium]|nr:bacillithiol system redox-active protein YtxJ [Vicinamibacterales bacterium]